MNQGHQVSYCFFTFYLYVMEGFNFFWINSTIFHREKGVSKREEKDSWPKHIWSQKWEQKIIANITVSNTKFYPGPNLICTKTISPMSIVGLMSEFAHLNMVCTSLSCFNMSFVILFYKPNNVCIQWGWTREYLSTFVWSFWSPPRLNYHALWIELDRHRPVVQVNFLE